VAFVSLTDASRSVVESFVKTYSIPWPCGYGTTMETIGAFGAYSTQRIRPDFNPEQEVTPTFYLIGRDGHVVWNDGQARPLHLKDSATLLQDLDAEIEHYLAAEEPGE
jgi:hypothetical protein